MPRAPSRPPHERPSIRRSAAPRLYAFSREQPIAAVADDAGRLSAIAAMGFDWIIHPASRPDADGPRADGDVRRLAAASARHGLKLMLDLSADDPRGDETMAHLVDEGAQGFRIRRAAHVPPTHCRRLIDTARAKAPDTVFVADPLGAPFDRVLGLAGLGFDHAMSSAWWWDYRSAWFLDQQRRLSDVAPSIAFPDDPDAPTLGPRMNGGDGPEHAERMRFAYLKAASLAAGILMPAGFEHGYAADARHSPDAAALDLSETITAINRRTADLPARGTDPPLRRATGTAEPLVGLVRGDPEGDVLVALLNPDPNSAHAIDAGRIAFAAGGRALAWDAVITPGDAPGDAADDAHERPLLPGTAIEIPPLSGGLFVGRQATARPAPDVVTARRAIERLAGARVSIEAVHPSLDGGRFPVKRTVGDVLTVTADIFSDGHDRIGAHILWQEEGANAWHTAEMRPIVNDRWSGGIPLARNTRYRYTVEAWRDPFESWRDEVLKKRAAGRSLSLEIIEGRALVDAAEQGKQDGSSALSRLARHLRVQTTDDAALEILLADDLRAVMAVHGPRDSVTRHPVMLDVVVDRTAARFAAWYEMFPRSAGPDHAHGTFDDVIARLPYVRDLGFDVLYFPPIHPIGRTKRKGKNNAALGRADEPGSPYAIGAPEGGHTAVHPDLGTLEDFRRLVAAAAAMGIEIALDFAIQCSPDHPWIREHPDWFDWRPDGTLKHAENPPKVYEDIVNVHFYGSSLPSLWEALRDVILFWIEQGVLTFRVDNPHTKPFPFWEWLIRDVQTRHPDAIFLSEAFTRPKPMLRLAKLGFTQSYTYFTWRNTKAELTQYLTELTQGDHAEAFRPNFFVNTPDINPPYLQTGGRSAHRVRLVLAATLSPLYGVYSGFELCEATPIPGREEYLDAEKYEIKDWWSDRRPDHIRDDIALVNRLRRENPALQRLSPLAFFPVQDDAVIAYAKTSPDLDPIGGTLLMLVNLDPHTVRTAWVELQFERFGLASDGAYRMVDLASGHAFTWFGRHHQVRLDPNWNPYMILRLDGVD